MKDTIYLPVRVGIYTTDFDGIIVTVRPMGPGIYTVNFGGSGGIGDSGTVGL